MKTVQKLINPSKKFTTLLLIALPVLVFGQEEPDTTEANLDLDQSTFVSKEQTSTIDQEQKMVETGELTGEEVNQEIHQEITNKFNAEHLYYLPHGNPQEIQAKAQPVQMNYRAPAIYATSEPYTLRMTPFLQNYSRMTLLMQLQSLQLNQLLMNSMISLQQQFLIQSSGLIPNYRGTSQKYWSAARPQDKPATDRQTEGQATEKATESRPK